MIKLNKITIEAVRRYNIQKHSYFKSYYCNDIFQQLDKFSEKIETVRIDKDNNLIKGESYYPSGYFIDHVHDQIKGYYFYRLYESSRKEDLTKRTKRKIEFMIGRSI